MVKVKNLIPIFILTLFFSYFPSYAKAAGQTTNTTLYQNKWVQLNGNWYYYNSNGTKQIGWLLIGGKWYNFNSVGVMQTNWVQSGSKWYFLNSYGVMQTGWVQHGDKWYFLNSYGTMQIGWVQSSGKWYFLDSHGVMKTGWLQWNKNWYYLYSSGSMAVNTIIDGYKVGSDGSWTSFTLYDSILNTLQNVKTEVDLSQYTTNSQVAFDTLTNVLNDHPEIFYLSTDGNLFWSNGLFDFKYTASKSQITTMQQALNKKVQDIINGNITYNMTDFDKVLALHNYIGLNTSYDYNNYLNNTIPDESYTMYGDLIKKTAVCDGYAKALQYLLNEVGIETIRVTGTANGVDHAWDKVKLSGEWYNLDPTWDDPVPDKPGFVRFNYFLVPDNILAKDHIWNQLSYPKATSVKYEYMSDLNQAVKVGNSFIYSSNSDNLKLYRISIDGASKIKFADVRAVDLVTDRTWIYFSNYSNGGYLYKIKVDGTNLTQLNSSDSENLSIQDGCLYYLDVGTSQEKKLQIN